jgi:hypothetical protein
MHKKLFKINELWMHLRIANPFSPVRLWVAPPNKKPLLFAVTAFSFLISEKLIQICSQG